MRPSEHLLLIGGDPGLGPQVGTSLRQGGLSVLEAATPAEGERFLPGACLVILDLPDWSRPARDLMARGISFLVIAGSRTEALRALERGAEDAVSRPFDPLELMARVQNLLRRYGRTASQPLALGALRLDAAGRRLLGPGSLEVPLTRGEFELLLALVKARGRVLSRAALADAISLDGALPVGRSVDVLVSRLRRKLEEDPRHPALVQTVPGMGYRIGALARAENEIRFQVPGLDL